MSTIKVLSATITKNRKGEYEFYTKLDVSRYHSTVERNIYRYMEFSNMLDLSNEEVIESYIKKNNNKSTRSDSNEIIKVIMKSRDDKKKEFIVDIISKFKGDEIVLTRTSKRKYRKMALFTTYNGTEARYTTGERIPKENMAIFTYNFNQND